MRVFAGFLVFILLGCHPSATVQRTMPVANLQTYSTVVLRVRSTAFAAQGPRATLEAAVLATLNQRCGFRQAAAGAPADLILDLTVTHTGTGGSGWISNDNVVTIDSLLVLTDGVDGSLVGTAAIQGKSSGQFINGDDPTQEATGAIAKSVGDLLAESGCTGPRVARAAPAPVPVATTTTTAPDESKRPAAEKLNDDGKDRLYNSDLPGALALFQQANALLPDARYEYNGCVVLGTLERWAEATASCTRARSMNPAPALLAKIDSHLEQYAAHH
ncbi:MAG TPA: hypothetical protein VGM90_25990 [Kofleriaceae bacterium]|jgi:hypothetical protein